MTMRRCVYSNDGGDGTATHQVIRAGPRSLFLLLNIEFKNERREIWRIPNVIAFWSNKYYPKTTTTTTKGIKFVSWQRHLNGIRMCACVSVLTVLQLHQHSRKQIELVCRQRIRQQEFYFHKAIVYILVMLCSARSAHVCLCGTYERISILSSSLFLISYFCYCTFPNDERRLHVYCLANISDIWKWVI